MHRFQFGCNPDLTDLTFLLPCAATGNLNIADTNAPNKHRKVVEFEFPRMSPSVQILLSEDMQNYAY